MDEHLDSVCRAMLKSLSFCHNTLAGFHDLATTTLADHISQLKLQAGGPLLPWLTLPFFTFEALAGKVTGEDTRLPALYQVAAAWELGNLAATHLDAWQDEDTDDALWRQVGPRQAVNQSVGLIALSFRILSNLGEMDLLAAPTVLKLKREFEDTLLRMVQGQHADLGDDLHLEEYQTVVAAKTGSLFRLACWSGAAVAGSTAEVAEQYGVFGEALGLLIQAWNDLYGLEGILGKQDQGHQRTLPVLASLAMAERDGAQSERPALEQGGKLFAVMQAAVLHQQAAEALARCLSPGRLPLFLAAYAVDRFLGRTGDGDGQAG